MGNPGFERGKEADGDQANSSFPSTTRMVRPRPGAPRDDHNLTEAGWQAWSRNIRQRADINHTEAPLTTEIPDAGPSSNTSEDSEARPESPRSPVWGLRRTALQKKQMKKEYQAKHKFTVRLGYDPHVFLEDPALRGQKLLPEAEAWAEKFRENINMVTDPKLSRRLEPEASFSPSIPYTRRSQRTTNDELRVNTPVQIVSSDDDDFEIAFSPNDELPGADSDPTNPNVPHSLPRILRRSTSPARTTPLPPVFQMLRGALPPPTRAGIYEFRLNNSSALDPSLRLRNTGTDPQEGTGGSPSRLLASRRGDLQHVGDADRRRVYREGFTWASVLHPRAQSYLQQRQGSSPPLGEARRLE